MPQNPEAQLKGFSFGTCSFSRTSPKIEALRASTQILNVVVSLEEALKLSLAIDECVRRLNSYKRSTRIGKNSGLNVAIHLTQKRDYD